MKLTTLAIVVLLGICYSSTGNATLSITVSPQGTPTCNPGTAVICPRGDLGSIQVKVTETPAQPGTTITCFAAVPGFCFVLGQNPQAKPQDSRGDAFFVFSSFGGCGNLAFQATSPTSPPSPVSPTVYVASPDADATCSVVLTDFINFASSYQTTNPCSDYDCDGIVALPDFITFASHYGH